MDGSRAEKIKISWQKVDKFLENILSESSFLNHHATEVFDDVFWKVRSRLKKTGRFLQNISKEFYEKIINYDFKKGLEEFSKEPFSKTAVLAAANLAVFGWLYFNGTVSNLMPNNLSAYIPLALGAEAEEEKIDSFASTGLKEESGLDGVMEDSCGLEGNNLSQSKCESDKKEGRCSDLCADIEQYVKLSKDMSEEEKRGWEKYVSSKPKIASNLSNNPARISCKEAHNGHPSKSDTKGKHMDEDCCPDPDEWPKPGCIYNAEGLALMLKGPPKKK